MVIGHRAGEAAIAYEHGADIEALMPKLRHSDYFTEPKVQELAAMERAEPGYCRRVADFVVGRKVGNFYCCCLYSCQLYFYCCCLSQTISYSRIADANHITMSSTGYFAVKV